METKDGISTFYAKDQEAWRAWLEQNHEKEKNIWLIMYRKGSNTPSVYYPEAVEEALCFGWIDSKGNTRDADSHYQFFSKRNPKSNWSRVNKQKVERLLQENKMAPAGLEMVALAKKTGTWTALDDVEELVVPADLQQALDANPQAQENFTKFPRSPKRAILEWIMNAKQTATREKRIAETVEKAARNERANQYQKKIS